MSFMIWRTAGSVSILLALLETRHQGLAPDIDVVEKGPVLAQATAQVQARD